MDIILKSLNDPLVLIKDYVTFINGMEEENNIFLLCDSLMEEDEKVEIDQILNQIISILEKPDKDETPSKRLSPQQSFKKVSKSLKNLTKRVAPAFRADTAFSRTGLTVNKKKVRKSRIVKKSRRNRTRKNTRFKYKGGSTDDTLSINVEEIIKILSELDDEIAKKTNTGIVSKVKQFPSNVANKLSRVYIATRIAVHHKVDDTTGVTTMSLSEKFSRFFHRHLPNVSSFTDSNGQNIGINILVNRYLNIWRREPTAFIVFHILTGFLVMGIFALVAGATPFAAFALGPFILGCGLIPTAMILLYAYSSLRYYFNKKIRSSNRDSIIKLNLLDQTSLDDFQHGCRLFYIERSLDEIIEDAKYYREGTLERDDIKTLKTILEPYHKSEGEIAELLYNTVIESEDFKEMVSNVAQEEQDALVKQITDIIGKQKGNLRHLSALTEIAQDIADEVKVDVSYDFSHGIIRGRNRRDFFLKEEKDYRENKDFILNVAQQLEQFEFGDLIETEILKIYLQKDRYADLCDRNGPNKDLANEYHAHIRELSQSAQVSDITPKEEAAKVEVQLLIDSQGKYETLQSLRKKYRLNTENWSLYTFNKLSIELDKTYDSRLPIPWPIHQYCENIRISSFTLIRDEFSLKKVSTDARTARREGVQFESSIYYDLIGEKSHKLRTDELEKIVKDFENYLDCRQMQIEDMLKLSSAEELPYSFRQLIDEAKQLSPQNIKIQFQTAKDNAQKFLTLAVEASKTLTDDIAVMREQSGKKAQLKENFTGMKPEELSEGNANDTVKIIDRWTSDESWKVKLDNSDYLEKRPWYVVDPVQAEGFGWVPVRYLKNIQLMLRTHSGSEFFPAGVNTWEGVKWSEANHSFFYSFYQPEILAITRKMWNELNEFEGKEWKHKMSVSSKVVEELSKKLEEIERLKEHRAAGNSLDPSQLAKLGTEEEVREQQEHAWMAREREPEPQIHYLNLDKRGPVDRNQQGPMVIRQVRANMERWMNDGIVTFDWVENWVSNWCYELWLKWNMAERASLSAKLRSSRNFPLDEGKYDFFYGSPRCVERERLELFKRLLPRAVPFIIYRPCFSTIRFTPKQTLDLDQFAFKNHGSLHPISFYCPRGPDYRIDNVFNFINEQLHTEHGHLKLEFNTHEMEKYNSLNKKMIIKINNALSKYKELTQKDVPVFLEDRHELMYRIIAQSIYGAVRSWVPEGKFSSNGTWRGDLYNLKQLAEDEGDKQGVQYLWSKLMEMDLENLVKYAEELGVAPNLQAKKEILIANGFIKEGMFDAHSTDKVVTIQWDPTEALDGTLSLGITFVHNPLYGAQILAIDDHLQGSLQVGMVLKELDVNGIKTTVTETPYKRIIELLRNREQPFEASFSSPQPLPETEIFKEGRVVHPQPNTKVNIRRQYHFNLNSRIRMSKLSEKMRDETVSEDFIRWLNELDLVNDDDNYIANFIFGELEQKGWTDFLTRSELIWDEDTEIILDLLAYLLLKRKAHEDIINSNEKMIAYAKSLNGKLLHGVKIIGDNIDIDIRRLRGYSVTNSRRPHIATNWQRTEDGFPFLEVNFCDYGPHGLGRAVGFGFGREGYLGSLPEHNFVEAETYVTSNKEYEKNIDYVLKSASVLSQISRTITIKCRILNNPFIPVNNDFDNNFSDIYEDTQELLLQELLGINEQGTNEFSKILAFQQLANNFTKIKDMRKNFDENKFFASMAKESHEIMSKLGLNVADLEEVEREEEEDSEEEDSEEDETGAGVGLERQTFENPISSELAQTFEIEGRSEEERPESQTFENPISRNLPQTFEIEGRPEEERSEAQTFENPISPNLAEAEEEGEDDGGLEEEARSEEERPESQTFENPISRNLPQTFEVESKKKKKRTKKKKKKRKKQEVSDVYDNPLSPDSPD